MTPLLFIYKISQTKSFGYDTYDSAVVIAESELAARNMHPGGCPWGSSDWALSPDDVTVELIGRAFGGAIPRVVCASFNHG